MCRRAARAASIADIPCARLAVWRRVVLAPLLFARCCFRSRVGASRLDSERLPLRPGALPPALREAALLRPPAARAADLALPSDAVLLLADAPPLPARVARARFCLGSAIV